MKSCMNMRSRNMYIVWLVVSTPSVARSGRDRPCGGSGRDFTNDGTPDYNDLKELAENCLADVE